MNIQKKINEIMEMIRNMEDDQKIKDALSDLAWAAYEQGAEEAENND